MNKKFIRLHNASDNSIIIVNVDAIDFIDTDEIDGRTVSQIIHTNSDIDSFNVNESPDKIWTLMSDEYKMITKTTNK